jgi:putative ABC transport system permease protein
MSLVVRSRAQDPAALAATVRSRVAQLDPALPFYNTRTMDDVFYTALAQPRFSATVLGLFAALALVLAAVGVYGVLAYSISRRTREMAIRVALGAQRQDVLRLVLGQGMKMTLVGAAIGLVGAFAVTRLLESQLYGVSTLDPLPFISTTLALGVTALLACYIPARRAARVDPIQALRHE